MIVMIIIKKMVIDDRNIKILGLKVEKEYLTLFLKQKKKDVHGKFTRETREGSYFN